MPSEFQSAGSDGEALPEWRQAIADRIGEDPGRWLDRDLVEYGPSHTDWTRKRAVDARIQGIRDRDVIRAWLEVETTLERESCPRQQIIRWLNQRDQQLKQHAERETRVEPAPQRSASAGAADDGPDLVHDACGTVVAARDGPGYRCPDCETVTRSVAELSAVSNADPVAADGGDA